MSASGTDSASLGMRKRVTAPHLDAAAADFVHAGAAAHELVGLHCHDVQIWLPDQNPAGQ